MRGGRNVIRYRRDLEKTRFRGEHGMSDERKLLLGAILVAFVFGGMIGSYTVDRIEKRRHDALIQQFKANVRSGCSGCDVEKMWNDAVREIAVRALK